MMRNNNGYGRTTQSSCVMGDHRSKDDEVMKLSSSIFVTNFPDKFSAKELWTVCNQYGNVVDAFIPDRRSKSGERFGFVRFIKIFDVDRLVNNLCTIWVGPFKLHANIARFHRPPLNKNNSQLSYNKGDKNVSKEFHKEREEWEEGYLHSKRVCIKTKLVESIYESFKIIIQGKIFWIRAKEVSGWIHDFEEDDDDDSKSDDEMSKEGIFNENGGMHKFPNGEGESDLEEVAETIFEKEKSPANVKEDCIGVQKDTRFEDQFNIYELLNKNKDNNNGDLNSDDNLIYPMDLLLQLMKTFKIIPYTSLMWKVMTMFIMFKTTKLNLPRRRTPF
ncbi:hypothetical protein CTI12_AA346880 [Artemisia annua]|uniref:RRM domain-containing protein n=1 Tax=Artemisia annua TaxID=35608 RepID=A0A2U1MS91_ARTAN|nr:hypothetical protein CTI12_AA346880 [Artemisia annua]